MTLYQPAAFHAAANVGRTLAAAFPFATLITPAADGPWISHVPLVADPDDPDCLLGHLANANGHADALAFEPSVAVFHGEHGYISPRWYQSPGLVPTWNYRIAHAHGQAERLDDAGLQRVLLLTSRVFEGPDGWQPEAVPEPALAAMRQQLTGFRLRVHRWDVKEKLSQNRQPADVASVIQALQQGDAGSQALAAIMQARTGQTG